MRWGGLVGLVLMLGCGPKVGPGSDSGAEAGGGSEGDSAVDEGGIVSVGSAVTGDSVGGVTSDGGVTSNGGDAPKYDVLSPTSGSSDTVGCQPWASEGCALESPGISLVHGGTPLGEVAPQNVAFFAGAPGCDYCVSMSRIGGLFFVPDPSTIEDVVYGQLPTDGLVLDLHIFAGPVDQEIVGTLTMYRDGEAATTHEAIFTIHELPEPNELGEPFDPSMPPMISGTVLADEEPGWSLHGDFWAAYCPQLNEYALCE